MMLEYSQRLQSQQRNVAASAQQPHVGSHMLLAAVQGGAQASGRAVAGLAVGQQADWVELDGQHLALAGLPAAEQLDAHVFASSRSSAVARVWVGGQCRVADGRHPLHHSAQRGFVAARSELLQEP